MALVKCRECGKEMSDKAAACPQCGAPGAGALTVVPPKQAKHYGCGTLLLLGIVGTVIYYAATSTHRASQSPGSALPKATVVAPPAAKGQPSKPAPAAPALGSQWIYTSEADDMGKGITKGAAVQSTNTFTLEFPFTTPQRATLAIRKHPRHGKDIIFFVEKGQLHCEYRACNWSIRFDDGNPSAFTLSEPQSRATEAMFIQNFDRFYGAMKKAKRVRIEAQFYSQGAIVMDFDVSGFDPKRIE